MQCTKKAKYLSLRTDKAGQEEEEEEEEEVEVEVEEEVEEKADVDKGVESNREIQMRKK